MRKFLCILRDLLHTTCTHLVSPRCNEIHVPLNTALSKPKLQTRRRVATVATVSPIRFAPKSLVGCHVPIIEASVEKLLTALRVVGLGVGFRVGLRVGLRVGMEQQILVTLGSLFPQTMFLRSP